MPASNLGAAKRAFVKVLLSLAVSYAVALEVNRDSADSDVMRAYKRPVGFVQNGVRSARQGHHVQQEVPGSCEGLCPQVPEHVQGSCGEVRWCSCEQLKEGAHLSCP